MIIVNLQYILSLSSLVLLLAMNLQQRTLTRLLIYISLVGMSSLRFAQIAKE